MIHTFDSKKKKIHVALISFYFSGIKSEDNKEGKTPKREHLSREANCGEQRKNRYFHGVRMDASNLIDRHLERSDKFGQ